MKTPLLEINILKIREHIEFMIVRMISQDYFS